LDFVKTSRWYFIRVFRDFDARLFLLQAVGVGLFLILKKKGSKFWHSHPPRVPQVTEPRFKQRPHELRLLRTYTSYYSTALAPRGAWLRQKSCQEISCNRSVGIKEVGFV
jgi:hypothetical protein